MPWVDLTISLSALEAPASKDSIKEANRVGDRSMRDDFRDTDCLVMFYVSLRGGRGLAFRSAYGSILLYDISLGSL